MCIVLSTVLYANTVNMAPIISYLLSDLSTSDNQKPMAVILPEVGEVSFNTNYILDGSLSSDPDGDELTYKWTQLTGPDVTAGVGYLTGQTASFISPSYECSISFSLTVSDPYSSSNYSPIAYISVLEHGPGSVLYISPTGSDSYSCSIEAPCITISYAIDKAYSIGMNGVFIQQGVYEESIELRSGISLFGGFDTNWNRTGLKTSKILSNGIKGHDVDSLTIDNLYIEADSPSDIYALMLTNSWNINITNNEIRSSQASDGDSGYNGASGGVGYSGTNGQSGDEDDDAGGAGGNGGSGAYSGGDGGDGRYEISGENGVAGNSGVFLDGAGGSKGIGGSSGDPGEDGTKGGAGAPGESGSDGSGASFSITLTSSGITYNNSAQPGTHGGSGGGGGGGGAGGGQNDFFALNGTGNGGGGGGGAGYRGTAGTAGSNGSSSIAIYLYNNSSILITNNTIVSLGGGDGGTGGTGGTGGNGGAGGFGSTFQDGDKEVGYGGDGGDGGDGGRGGHGGGGLGGSSIGILSEDSDSFTASGNSYTIYNAGIAGSSPGNSGARGESVNIYINLIN